MTAKEEIDIQKNWEKYRLTHRFMSSDTFGGIFSLDCRQNCERKILHFVLGNNRGTRMTFILYALKLESLVCTSWKFIHDGIFRYSCKRYC